MSAKTRPSSPERSPDARRSHRGSGGKRSDAPARGLPTVYDGRVPDLVTDPTNRTSEPTTLVELIRASVIGDDEAVAGPFGIRRVTYADYTASGRALTFIEDYLREAVLPLYANTHTESSGTGLQTSRYREEARGIIRSAVGGTDDHAVIFCGSGMTAAINKLVDVLNIRIPADLDDRYSLRSHIPARERPLVFIGPYEHHSNELPWRESLADVVTIGEDADGRIDLAGLERALEASADRPTRIGSFSAASNVTGILSDTRAISILLHRHGALSIWDFAAAGPYVQIEMSPHRPGPDAELDYKDAIVLSPHKFIGGPGTPGVLVARRELFRNRVPPHPAGEPSSTSTPSNTSTWPTRSIARKGARRRSSNRSARVWRSSSRSGSATRRSGNSKKGSSVARWPPGAESRRSACSAIRRCRGYPSSRSRSATTVDTSTTTSWWPC